MRHPTGWAFGAPHRENDQAVIAALVVSARGHGYDLDVPPVSALFDELANCLPYAGEPPPDDYVFVAFAKAGRQPTHRRENLPQGPGHEVDWTGTDSGDARSGVVIVENDDASSPHRGIQRRQLSPHGVICVAAIEEREVDGTMPPIAQDFRRASGDGCDQCRLIWKPPLPDFRAGHLDSGQRIVHCLLVHVPSA